MDVFAPYFTPAKYGTFIVRNICTDRRKTIKIFQYPILYNTTRDLLAIPGVAEQDIRASLLKGEIRHKILAGDIIVESSDIDLLQFNLVQKTFLQGAGIVNGLDVSSLPGGGITAEQHETLRQLIHLADGVGGPLDGFTSGAYRETLPTNSPFPTSLIWWDSPSKLNKIVAKTLTYDAHKRITITSWTVYDVGGNPLATVTDTFNYIGNSPFESSRVRTVS